MRENLKLVVIGLALIAAADVAVWLAGAPVVVFGEALVLGQRAEATL